MCIAKLVGYCIRLTKNIIHNTTNIGSGVGSSFLYPNKDVCWQVGISYPKPDAKIHLHNMILPTIEHKAM